jgi:hypothetical protein
MPLLREAYKGSNKELNKGDEGNNYKGIRLIILIIKG